MNKHGCRLFFDTKTLYAKLGFVQFNGQAWQWAQRSLPLWTKTMLNMELRDHIIVSAKVFGRNRLSRHLVTPRGRETAFLRPFKTQGPRRYFIAFQGLSPLPFVARHNVFRLTCSLCQRLRVFLSGSCFSMWWVPARVLSASTPRARHPLLSVQGAVAHRGAFVLVFFGLPWRSSSSGLPLRSLLPGALL